MSHTLTLGQKQRLFCSLIAELIRWLYANGYECSFGEATRSDEQAEINAIGAVGRTALVAHLRTNSKWNLLAEKIKNNTGSGIRGSLHEKRLAIDLNLFKDGVYQMNTTAHEPLGAYWESLHPLCRWGGRFTSPDGNHYSIEHEGVK